MSTDLLGGLRDRALEAALLGAVLLRPADYPLLQAHVPASCFDCRPFPQIRHAMDAVAADGRNPDFLSVRGWLVQHGQMGDAVTESELSALVSVGTPRLDEASFRAHGEWLRRMAAARRAGYVCERALANLQSRPEVIRNGFFRDLAEEAAAIEAEAVGDTGAAGWAQTGPAFAEHANEPPAAPLVDGLVPGEGITLLHADPRSFKSWIALDVAVSVAASVVALSQRCVPAPGPVLYLSNEDSPRVTAERATKLARGKGLTALPERLLFGVHAGIWLDDEHSQSQVIVQCKRDSVRLVVLDPLRSLTGAVDQGPRELQPFTRFLRRLMDATGCTVLAVHHDTKPVPGVADTRKRAYRASGGGLFSIADAPIHAERVGDDPVVLLHPSAWKHADTPGPLEVRLTVTDESAVLEAHAVDATTAVDRDLQLRILDYLKAEPGRSGSEVARGIKVSKATVLQALETMAESGVVDSHPGAHRSVLWFPDGLDG